MPSARASAPAPTSPCRRSPSISTGPCELLADNELHPALPDQAMDDHPAASSRRRRRRATSSPGFLTQRSLRRRSIPAGDPSLRMATPETVHALTPDDVRGYYRACSGPT